MLSYETKHSLPSSAHIPFAYHYGDTSVCPEYSPNWHIDIEIITVLKGEGHFVCNDRDFVAKEGDIVVFNSDVVHRIYSDTKMVFLCYIIDSDFCTANGLNLTDVYFCEHITDENLCILFKEVMKEYGGQYKSKISSTRTRFALLKFMIELHEKYAYQVKHSEFNVNYRSYEYIKKAIEYIRLNIKEKLTLEDISGHVNVSRFHLSKEFKRLTGKTIFEFVNITRCNKADLLLRQGVSATETAHLCGFENLSYFSRTFKKYIGKLPSEIYLYHS